MVKTYPLEIPEFANGDGFATKDQHYWDWGRREDVWDFNDYGVTWSVREEDLKDYIGLFTGCDSKDISDNTVLHFLSHSVKKFIDSNKLIEVLKNRNAESYLYRSIIPFLTKLYINLLIDRIATDLDLSDYDSIVKYCQNSEEFAVANNPEYFITQCKIRPRPWWRCFGNDIVEDDRR